MKHLYPTMVAVLMIVFFWLMVAVLMIVFFWLCVFIAEVLK